MLIKNKIEKVNKKREIFPELDTTEQLNKKQENSFSTIILGFTPADMKAY